jgi:exodeoxyribonuclease III
VRLLSWNVNGLRSAMRAGFWEWLQADAPDLLCLQEIRIQPEQLTEAMRHAQGYHASWHSAQRKGYSGVATLSRELPLAVQHGFGQERFDREGRVLLTEHPGFTLVNAYFPSGQRGHERVSFKLEFYDHLLAYCLDLVRQGKRLVVCGDLNTAHQPIDLARPGQNKKTSGFLPEEREALGRWLESGFVDIYRHLHPEAREYTWWSYLHNARARNVGWRIDYFLVTVDLLPVVRGAAIRHDVSGSDHCPVELCLDLAPTAPAASAAAMNIDEEEAA